MKDIMIIVLVVLFLTNVYWDKLKDNLNEATFLVTVIGITAAIVFGWNQIEINRQLAELTLKPIVVAELLNFHFQNEYKFDVQIQNQGQVPVKNVNVKILVSEGLMWPPWRNLDGIKDNVIPQGQGLTFSSSLVYTSYPPSKSYDLKVRTYFSNTVSNVRYCFERSYILHPDPLNLESQTGHIPCDPVSELES